MKNDINRKETVNKRKKTTLPKGVIVLEEEKNTKLVLKLIRGYYNIYVK